MGGARLDFLIRLLVARLRVLGLEIRRWRLLFRVAETIVSEEEAAPSASAVAKLRSHPRVHWSEKDLGDRPRRRIVSLVPSLSEAIELLGMGDRLVGVTEYCVLPEGAFDGLPKLGGTKDADVAAIAALAPDLVIANEEENTARVVRQLAERDAHGCCYHPEHQAYLVLLPAAQEHHLTPLAEREGAALRFGIGARVECKVGVAAASANGWASGEVIALWYVQGGLRAAVPYHQPPLPDPPPRRLT